jgi:hypothetical protein
MPQQYPRGGGEHDQSGPDRPKTATLVLIAGKLAILATLMLDFASIFHTLE